MVDLEARPRSSRNHVPIREHCLELPVTPYFDGETELDAAVIAEGFLLRFGYAVSQSAWETFEDLFVDDGWWKDSLALTFDKRTLRGRKDIVKAWTSLSALRRPQSWSLETEHTGVKMGPPVWTRQSPTMASLDISFSFDLQDPKTRCIGMFKLLPDHSHRSINWKIWILNTVAISFPDHPFRPLPKASPGLVSPSQRGKAGAQGLPRLDGDAVFDAVVVGFSSSGMANIIQLESIGLDIIAFDKEPTTGGFWSTGRYESVQLHHPKRMIQLPQYPVPDQYQKYLSGRDLSDYFSSAVRDLQLPTFSGIKVTSNTWDEGFQLWTSRIEDVRTGETMLVKSKNLVLSNGYLVTRIHQPHLPGQEDFRGTRTHSYHVRGVAPFADKDVLIVGAGNSAHDIAGQICKSGQARSISILQRSPMVLLEFSQLGPTLFGLYDGDLPVEVSDVLQDALPNIVARPLAKDMLQKHLDSQADLNKALEAKGYLLGNNPDIVGIVEERGRGFYMDQPRTLELVLQDKIKILRGEAKAFTPTGVITQHKDEPEQEVKSDAVIFATGFQDVHWPSEWAESGFLDKESAGRILNVGQWGFDKEGEFPGFVTASGHPNLFFAAIALFNTRWVGKLTAMQVMANVTGTTPPVFSRD